MDDAVANEIKAKLDAELAGRPDNVGIAFGLDPFYEFRDRGWLTLEKFGALGTSLFEARVPAYGRTHYAFPTWDIPENEFRVGRSTA
jgi:hypothetical protein